METKIVIRDFDNSENLETYLHNKIEDSIAPFLKNYESTHIHVTVQEDRHRNQARKPHFQCEVRLSLPGSKTMMHVKKEGDHFYECVQKVTDTLREIMSRKHKQMSNRRKRSLRSVPYDYSHYVA